MARPLDHPALLLRTVRHLRPAQVAHRVRLRAQRAAFARVPAALPVVVRQRVGERVGWPPGFVPLDAIAMPPGPSAEVAAAGQFRFLEDGRSLGDPPDWLQAAVPQLWRFHLHYFEWAWAFAAHGDRAWAAAAFARLWRSWRHGTRPAAGDAWSPYVVSMRAWALCGVYDTLVAGGPDAQDYVADLARHAAFIRAHLELDVGGNHLLKNLKALVGLGVFLDDAVLVARALGRLERELDVQVLADGGHYERSPSYHCQVLGDLIDSRELVRATGRGDPARLDDAVGAMRRWLGVMLMPDGDVPLFNDCTLVGHDRITALSPDRPPLEPLRVLEPSGYVVVRPDGRVHLVADVGPPSPPDLPAHAHADCLSFELAIDGRRAVVDSGTSTYQAGARRAYERSTRAHNTVEIDGADQTEVWGAFRAARRAEGRLLGAEQTGDVVEVKATHDGYRRLPGRPHHVRTWLVSASRLEVRDDVGGGGRHRVAAWLHLAPGVDPARVSVLGPEDVVVETVAAGSAPAGLVATAFGALQPSAAVVATVDGDMPVSLTTTFALEP